MQKFKNLVFYSWWLNYWLILLIAVSIFNWRVVVRAAPIFILAFVGYAFYVMLKTKPSVVEESESATPETKSDVETEPKK